MMVFDVSVALTWILFLALFPMAYFWLRNVWRIVKLRDYSEVALKGGASPTQPEKFASYAAIINLIAGGIAVMVILSIVLGWWEYQTWTAVAGITIWGKIIAEFILRQHAHPIFSSKKK